MSQCHRPSLQTRREYYSCSPKESSRDLLVFFVNTLSSLVIVSHLQSFFITRKVLSSSVAAATSLRVMAIGTAYSTIAFT